MNSKREFARVLADELKTPFPRTDSEVAKKFERIYEKWRCDFRASEEAAKVVAREFSKRLP